MKKTWIWLGVVVPCALADYAESQDFVFVEDGTPRCALVASKELMKLDVDAFTNAVFQCTGALLPVQEEGRPAFNLHPQRIVFAIDERPVTREDSYEVSFPDSRTLKISGTIHSCRWALNRILEDAFGVCFCLPGKTGTHYPRAKTVSLPRIPWSDRPVYELERDDEGSMDPRWKRCLNAKYFERVDTTSHMLRDIFRDPKFFKEPWVSKLMPLIGGERKPPKNIVKLWEPCFSCEEGIDEAVKFITARLRANPKQKWFSLGVNDCGGFCECDGCKAMNGGSVTNVCRFDKNYPMFSDAYGRWCNKIAARLEKEFPDVMLGYSAYRETIDPPRFKLHKNIAAAFCMETMQWMDAENRERFSALIGEWSKVCDHLILSDYAYGHHYQVPRMYNHLLQEVLSSKLTKFPSLNGWHGETGDPWAEGPKFWLHFKLLWKPDVDLDRTLDTWYRACAGDEAAPYLKAFYDEWEDFWFTEDVKKTLWYTYTSHFVYFWFFWQQYLYALDASRVERCEKLIDQALSAAERSGNADQKIRMRELAVWQRQAVAAAFAGCAGAVTNPLGDLRNADDIAFFEKNFPRMQRYELLSRECFDKITSFIERDIDGIVDTPKWRCHLGLRTRKAERFSRAPNRVRLINQYLKVKNGAADATGPNYVPEDAMPEGTNARVMSDLGRSGWTVVAEGRSPDIRLIVAGDRTEREYFAGVTVRNTTSHRLSFTLDADTWSVTGKRAFNNPSGLSGEAEPGETATVNVLMREGRTIFSGETDILLKVSFANLKMGETVKIEALSLRLPSERCLRIDSGARVMDVKREQERVNTTTWEDQQDL